MSKLAFCLRSDIGVPYDRLVHIGISRYFGGNIRHHECPDYVSGLNKLFEEFDAELQITELTEDFREILHPDFLEESIFKRRAADHIPGFSENFQSES